MDVYVMNTLECLWMVCHMGTFLLLEGCDKGSKPSLLILAEEVLSRGLQELVSLTLTALTALPCFEIVPSTLPLSLCERCSNII